MAKMIANTALEKIVKDSKSDTKSYKGIIPGFESFDIFLRE